MENTCVCCGDIIPEGRQVCSVCENWESTQNKYIKFNCPECGAPLEVWCESVIDNMPKFQNGNYQHEACFLIRHCNNCHRDWENIWCIEDGETSETPLRRKFWG